MSKAVNEELTMELTVQDVNNLIQQIELLRHGLDTNNLTENERKDIRYFLGLYIAILRKGRVVI